MWVLVGGLFFSACSTTQPVTEKEKSPFYDNAVVIMAKPETFSLANLLVQLPGVRVSGNQQKMTVTIRGGSPLFVLDGVRMGHDFNAITDLVNVFDVTAIELLRDPTETVMYGPDTQFGVIIIHTSPLDVEEDL